MIPVFEPKLGEAEALAVADAVRKGEISGSFGNYLPEFERRFADYCECQHGVAVSSGTTALHLAVDAAGIGPGDEVLVSASTNIATALAVHHNGASVIPVDSESETWNLDLDRIESLITPRSKAIIAVHLYGHPVDMDRLNRIAERHNLIVIEDAAEAHGATVRGRKVGSFGHMACFSFYANKIITTGEGGMVTTNDAKLAERIRLLRNLAFTKPRFWHEHAGYNFRMTGMQAAIGLAQLEQIESFIAAKRRLATTYCRHLSGIDGLRTPAEAAWARNVYWMFAVVVQSDFGISRDELMSGLAADGIETRTFFCPMNQQPCLRIVSSEGTSADSLCPVAGDLWERGLYLPSSVDLSDDIIRHIANRIRALQAAVRTRRLAA